MNIVGRLRNKVYSYTNNSADVAFLCKQFGLKNTFQSLRFKVGAKQQSNSFEMEMVDQRKAKLISVNNKLYCRL